MNGVLLIAAVVAVALARPETYKENEDFNYSRSSSDDGYKAGSYAAQRGNVGGNYEKAQNMDSLAQQQMSGAIRNVEGELGTIPDTNHGRVFTSANTRGVYSDRMSDLSNLNGRNFQDGTAYYGDSQPLTSSRTGYGTHSSLHDNAYSSGQSAYNSHRYDATKSSGYRQAHNANLEAIDQVNGNTNGFHEYGKESGYSSEYRREGGGYNSGAYNRERSQQASDRMVASNYNNRHYSGAPVKIMIRPGTSTYVPVEAETYVDSADARSTSAHHSSVNKAVDFVDNNDHQTVVPSSNSKHYESEYKYHKELERHDTRPIAAAAPLSIYPSNSELYDESASQRGHEFHRNDLESASQFNTHAASNSHSRYESQYNNQKSATNEAITNGAERSQPKRYESKYAYHKSWERQGDPYVIKPVTSERLTADSNQESHSSYQRNAHTRQSHQSYTQGGVDDCDCEEDVTRAKRSAPHSNDRQEAQQFDDLTQQSQTGWENFGQNRNTHGKLEDFGQQSEWKNEDLTQQSHSGWDNYRHQSGRGKLEDFSQTKFHGEDLTQQSENGWNNHRHQASGKLEDLNQQTQAHWGANDDLTQQSQSGWENYSQSQGKVDNNSFQESTNAWQQTYNERKPNVNQYHISEHVKDIDELNTDSQMHAATQGKIEHNHERPFSPEIGKAKFPNTYTPSTTQQHVESYGQTLNEQTFDSNSKSTVNSLQRENNDMQGLWDKIDNLSQQSFTGFDSEMYQNLHKSQRDYQSHNNWHGDYGTLQNTNYNNDFRWQSTPRTNKIEPLPSSVTVENASDNNEKPNKQSSVTNKGRGDIGADLSTNYKETQPNTDNTQLANHDTVITPKPYKTPEEIEVLSLTRGTEKPKTTTEDTLGVVGINQEWINEQKKHNTNYSTDLKATTDITYTIHHSNPNLYVATVDNGNHNDDVQVQQRTFDHQFGDQTQQSVNTWEDELKTLGHSIENNNMEQQHINLDQDFSSLKDQERNEKLQQGKQAVHEDQITDTRKSIPQEATFTTTEKPGFWKSVGNKFSSASSSVASWFKSS